MPQADYSSHGMREDIESLLDKVEILEGGQVDASEADQGDVLIADGDGGAAFGPLSVSVSMVSLVTATTGALADGEKADLDIALPAGIASCLICEAVVARTAGAATKATLTVHRQDDRADDSIYILGNVGTGATVNTTAIGPLRDIMGEPLNYVVPYRNTDGSEFIRAVLENTDGVENGTWDVTFKVVPLS